MKIACVYVCVSFPLFSFAPCGGVSRCPVTQEEGDTGGHAVKRIPGSNVPWRRRTKYPSFVSGHLSLTLSSSFLSPSPFFSAAAEHIVLRCFSRPLLHYRILSPKSESRHCDCTLCRAESVSVRASLSVYSLIEFKGELGNVGPELRSFH